MDWETIKLNTKTASRAPMESMAMPSQRKMWAMRLLGLTVRSIGTITVGSVTTTRAPNNRLSPQSKATSQCVVAAVTN